MCQSSTSRSVIPGGEQALPAPRGTGVQRGSPVRHVALHVVIPLKIASEPEWIVVVDDHEPGEEGRTDGQAWSRHSYSAGT